YYTEHGTLPEAKMVVDGVKLCRWHQAQVRAYQKGMLSAERIQLFKAAGIPLTSRNIIRKQQTWSNNYDSYVKFIRTYGRKPGYGEIFEGRNLYKWSYEQMARIRNNLLTSEQVSELRKIGVTGNGR
ncbi:MAG: helicase associated domain-containing protein, partial [Ruminococcus sp.]|nr:helicase associated domain-containing protein [Ruminococcus sp.]MBR2304208.1 helicase associated domain-containing protein [Ruminococcus sp.]